MSEAERNPVSEHLFAALDAEDEEERLYHIREASQLFKARCQGVGE